MSTNKARTPTRPRHALRLLSHVLFAAVLSLIPLSAVLAQTQPDLGTAASFSFLGRTGVTVTDCTIVGDVGIVPGGAWVNTNSTVTGTLHNGDPVAQAAYDDFLLAYTAVSTQPCQAILTGTLGGTSLPPGVYCFDAGATVTGVFTLLGPPDGIWIFKVGTGGLGALAATSFTMVMPGGQSCTNNVYWWTAEGAALTDSVFLGTVLAGTSFTTTRTAFQGRGMAMDAVTVTGPSSSCNCASLLFTPTVLPNPVAGVPYSVTLSASGGAQPYTYAVTGGALPLGLSLDPDGLLSGTPSVTGLYSFTVTATGADGCSGSMEYASFQVCPVITLTPAVLPNPIAGVPYDVPIMANGGMAPYTFALTAGSLPAGLTLSQGGLLYGTTAALGLYSFTVTATASDGCTGFVEYSSVQVCPLILVSPATLPAATVNVPYSQLLTATGGVAPYTFVVSGGSLPAGLTLSPGGLLSGTMTSTGLFAFEVTATDSSGCSGSVNYGANTGAYDVTLLDDHGGSQLCINSVSGAYSHYAFTGSEAGARVGTGTLGVDLLGRHTLVGSGPSNVVVRAFWNDREHVGQWRAYAEVNIIVRVREIQVLGVETLARPTVPRFIKCVLTDSDTRDNPPCGAAGSPELAPLPSGLPVRR